MQTLNYEESLELSYKDKKTKRVNQKFQYISAFLLVAMLAAKYPVVAGLSFLEKIPPQYQCLEVTSKKMHSDLKDQLIGWKSCTRDEICNLKLTKDMYRPVTTSAEYFVNWVPKFDLLCMPKAYIGFFASQFFVGVIFAIYFVPRYSDTNGRLNVMLGSITLQLLVQIGLLISDNLYFAYFCMFCLGCTFPGKNIVFYNYTMEIVDVKVRQTIVSFIAFAECSAIIWGTLYYQHISKNWVYIQYFCTTMTGTSLIFLFIYFYESPKFLYSQGRFNDARYSIQQIAKFNGVNTKEDFEFVFDTEVRNMDPLNASRHLEEVPLTAANEQNPMTHSFEIENEIGTQKNEISTIEQSAISCEQDEFKKRVHANYASNLVKMTVLWSAASFSNYLLNFLNKYLEGSIFTNNYYEGIANMLSIILGGMLYTKLGKKKSFIIAFALCVIGGVCIFCLETGSIMLPDSYLSQFAGTLKQRKVKAVANLVPQVTFIAKFGTGFCFLCCYQASFSDDTLFNSEVRATAIGSCQLIARALTILAPEITELKSPKPIMSFILVSLMALFTSFYLSDELKSPSESKLSINSRSELEQKLKKKLKNI